MDPTQESRHSGPVTQADCAKLGFPGVALRKVRLQKTRSLIQERREGWTGTGPGPYSYSVHSRVGWHTKRCSQNSFKKWKLYGTMRKDLYRGSFIYTHKHLPTASVLQGSPGGKAFLHAHCHYLWLSATSLHSQ